MTKPFRYMLLMAQDYKPPNNIIVHHKDNTSKEIDDNVLHQL